jgi:phage terminase large subunit-like protein
LSTQSDQPPAGVFAQILSEFRGIRDGKINDRRSLGGFKQSSQHHREECCDGRETAVGSSVTGQVEVARAARDGAT